jgi:hypothetical protein
MNDLVGDQLFFGVVSDINVIKNGTYYKTTGTVGSVGITHDNDVLHVDILCHLYKSPCTSFQ